MQLVNALKTSWKESIREQNRILNSCTLYDPSIHPSYKTNQVYPLGKLKCHELYNILILGNYKKPLSQGISRLSLNPRLLIRKIFLCYHIRPPLT